MKSIALSYTMMLLTGLFLVSCSSSSKTTDASSQLTSVVGSVNGKTVSYDELVTQFKKGNPGNEVNSDEIREFLPVYLDYLAKLEMAKDAGYYSSQVVLEEYDLYSKQAAYAYWLDTVIRPTLFSEYKERYERVLKSSHILISVSQDASPADTLEAYTKLTEARKRFSEGASMAQLDSIYSTKQQGRSMGGELPWFSVGTTVKQFEDVLYGLEVGELSTPFRTQFGYHIVLLEEERQRVPDRLVSHIFLRADRAPAQLDSAIAELKAGDSWEDVVKKYTMDTPSANTGGRIGWVNYGSRYDADFIDTIMSLDPDSAHSDVLRSIYGFHILRIDSVRTFSTEEARDNFIMSQLESSNTFRKNNTFIVEWLDEHYSSYTNDSLLAEMTSVFMKADSSTFAEIDTSVFNSSDTLYQFGEFTYSPLDYVRYLDESGRGPLTNNYMKVWFKYFKEAMIDNNLVDFTLQVRPEFSEQTDNYLNGLVVYQINEDSVWSSATIDSTILRDRFEANKGSYQYTRRPYYHLISASRDSSLDKAIAFVQQGNDPDSIRISGIAAAVTRDSTGTFTGEPFDKLLSMEEGAFSDVFEYKNRKAVFYMNKMLPAREMTFEEAFDRLLAEYQPEREDEWLRRLRDRYDVSVYPENLPETNGADETPQN